MGVVVSFPTKARAARKRHAWSLLAVGAGVVLVALGILLAGQDLLRGAQADPSTKAAGPITQSLVGVS